MASYMWSGVVLVLGSGEVRQERKLLHFHFLLKLHSYTIEWGCVAVLLIEVAFFLANVTHFI